MDLAFSRAMDNEKGFVTYLSGITLSIIEHGDDDRVRAVRRSSQLLLETRRNGKLRQDDDIGRDFLLMKRR